MIRTNIHTALWLSLSLMLCACSHYQDDLKQNLSGASNEQKHIVLAKECENEIRKYNDPSNPVAALHADRMQEICEDMTGQDVHIEKAYPDK